MVASRYYCFVERSEYIFITKLNSDPESHIFTGPLIYFRPKWATFPEFLHRQKRLSNSLTYLCSPILKLDLLGSGTTEFHHTKPRYIPRRMRKRPPGGRITSRRMRARTFRSVGRCPACRPGGALWGCLRLGLERVRTRVAGNALPRTHPERKQLSAVHFQGANECFLGNVHFPELAHLFLTRLLLLQQLLLARRVAAVALGRHVLAHG